MHVWFAEILECWLLQEGGGRRDRGGGGSGRHEVQMMVPQDQVGSIIGRAGFKIKELREVCLMCYGIMISSHVVFA